MNFLDVWKRKIVRFFSAKNQWIVLVAFSTIVIFAPQNLEAITEANTLVENFSRVTYEQAGTSYVLPSNVSSFRVDELISLSIVSNQPTGVSTQEDTQNVVLSFTLSNLGNASEAFQLVLTQLLGDDFDVSNARIYLDADANGVFNSGIDTLYLPGTNDPNLAFEGSLQVFVVSDTPASLSVGDVAQLRLMANSLTGTGAPGTHFLGQGDGGVDAVLGGEGGTDFDQSSLLVETGSAVVTKSQSILDPDGGDAAVSGSIITYRLEIVLSGTGTFTNLVLSDPIPANSTYVASSMRLNNVALSDALDADAGAYNGTGISITLGSLNAPTTQVVTFQVRIQ